MPENQAEFWAFPELPKKASKPKKAGKPASLYADSLTLKEWKVVALRDAVPPERMFFCEQPDHAALFHQEFIQSSPAYNREVESMHVLVLNARRRVTGFYLVAQGTQDTILTHPRELYRPAVIAGAHAVIAMHNHPSGDATPSEADIRVTRELIRAGQMLKIELLDHVIIGTGQRTSLRELGYFYT